VQAVWLEAACFAAQRRLLTAMRVRPAAVPLLRPAPIDLAVRVLPREVGWRASFAPAPLRR